MDDIIASSGGRHGPPGGQIADQLRWFDITETDRRQAEALAVTADELAEQIIEDFYAHLLSFDDARRHFRSDEQIARVKKGQLKYFRELVTAALDEDYVRNRRQIGQIHERSGVTPTLYVGAYAYYLHRLGHRVMDRMQDDPGRALALLLSLIKIAHFDMAQALETYVEAREATIEQREREMSELPTPVLQLRDGLLLIPVVGTLDSYRARSLTVKLLEGIRDHRARAVVLDITGVAAVDSAVANHLIQTMTAARLMGASSVLTGLSAEVAQALVKIGVTGEALRTAGDLQHGIEMAERMLEI
ncbi:protoglobin domain-containing protein [Mangrovicoccus ximenensis]|uniref:protoglobin domain-containing protein n=1 Tax=Mangrovicoccus ximenensis TaxID=1911570 RepID=UPI000D36A981|nr:protoglobin domain-containing protein [Mangrovicoccus ximenensis]